MRKRFWKGLRTIELTIIVAIICIILGVVAIRFDNFKCRAMQSEAKFSLQEIYAAQKRFHSETNHYATFDELQKNGRIRINAKYYTYSDVKEPTNHSFLIQARGLESVLVAKEYWTVNEYKDIVLHTASCKE